jgi:arylsulfatase A-like enzyme
MDGVGVTRGGVGAALATIPAAVALEAAARAIAPAPFAPDARDVVAAFVVFGAAALPALALGLVARGRGRRAWIVTVLAGLPFGVLALDLAYVLLAVPGAAMREQVPLLAGGAAVGIAAGALAAARLRPRTLLAAAAAAAVVAVGARFLPAAHAPADAARAPSVLLVVLDTTAAGHLGAWGYARPTSPHLDRLAAASMHYARAVSPAPWTAPAHGSIFTGLYPSELGFEGDGFTTRPDGALASDLAATGRPAHAISANPWIPRLGMLRQGFERAWDVDDLVTPFPRKIADKMHGLWGYRGSGERVTTLALDWLDRLAPRDRPWFLFLNYLDPHAPYTPPAAEYARFATQPGPPPAVDDDTRPYNDRRLPLTPEVMTTIRDLYDAEIATMDAAFARLMDELARRGWDASNLLVVVTADHGESLGRHGFLGHLLAMTDDVLHVPLLVHGPGVAAGTVTAPVQTTQIRATVLGLLGAPVPAGIAAALPPWGTAPELIISERAPIAWYMEQLLAENHHLDVAPWEGSWVAVEQGSLKTVFDDRGRTSTFDLRTDPGETTPLPAADGAPLVAAYRRWQEATALTRARVPNATTAESLRALGYLR